MRVEARAKVNLFLRILGQRPDGYHDLETLIVPISLADRLEVHAAAGPLFRTLSLSLSLGGDPDMTSGVPVDETNLVLRAAATLAERAGVRGFADVSLEKLVPSAAGLGGGSADAAAALRALNHLWGLGLTDDDLVAAATEVGSDVPALLAGGPTVARGRGERVDAAAVGPLSWVVVTFPFGVRTADAFEWWDLDRGATGPELGPILDAVRPEALAGPGGLERLGSLLANDLAAPVMRRHPQVLQALDRLLEAGAVGAIQCGSGPSVAGLLGPGGSLDAAAEEDLARISGRRPIRATSGSG
jgi:4-diphosphocytidyl-2-C-methyl-D-erythritol kinase